MAGQLPGERLHPALFDRLIDESRFVTNYIVRTHASELSRLQINESALISVLLSQGLQLADEKVAADPVIPKAEIEWRFTALQSGPSPQQLKQLLLKPPGAPAGVFLQNFCSIEFDTILNTRLESPDKLLTSMRKIREYVQRDLGWLLNSASLDSVQSLQRYPEVSRSVLNYGMPSLAGKRPSMIDPIATARRMREAIEIFEPRLSNVQVLVESDDESDTTNLTFRIEADLWGYPAQQHLVMKSNINTETGNVLVGEFV